MRFERREAIEFTGIIASGAISLLLFLCSFLSSHQRIGNALDLFPLKPLIYWAGLMISFLLSSLLIGRKVKDRDPYILPLISFLSGMGLAFIYRISPDLASFYKNDLYMLLPTKQLYWIIGGCMLMVLAARWSYEPGNLAKLRKQKYIYILISMALVLLTSFIGVERNGHRLWLSFGPISIQTAEIVKALVILFTSAYLYEKMGEIGRKKVMGMEFPSISFLGPFLTMLAFCLLPVFLQKDFGLSVILCAIFLGSFYMATSLGAFSSIGLGLAILIGAISYLIGFPSILRTRVNMWLFPFQYSENLTQSLWAISSGGLWGTGFGAGMPYRVPVVYSDFSFSGISEELGHLGGTAIMLAFLLLSYRGFKAAMESGDLYKRLLTGSIMILLGIQAATIIGGVTGLIPLTGVTLPFVSYGGSSTVMNFLAAGVLIGVSGSAKGKGEQGISRSIRRSFSVISLIFLIAWARLAYLQVIAAPSIVLRQYEDRNLEEAVRKYARLGILKVGRGGKVLAEEERISGRYGRLVLLCLRRGLIVSGDDGNIRLAEGAGRISNPRLSVDVSMKGRILDRNGIPLAESIRSSSACSRRYPLGPATFHPLGYEHPVYGRAELELCLSGSLMGRREDLMKGLFIPFPRRGGPGDDVVLTIDSRIQMAAYQALGGRKGAAVVMDPRTGEILALVSSPAIDPNEMDPELWARSLKDTSSKPFLNRATGELYNPGSSIKPMIAAAALDSHSISVSDSFICKGWFRPMKEASYTIHDFEERRSHNPTGSRRWTVREALIVSCNVTFAQIGLRLGADKLFEYAKKFGFYKEYDLIPFKGASFRVTPSRIYPGAESLKDIPMGYFTKTHLAQSAIGQYELKVTPFQMALIASTIANGGERPAPKIVKEIRSKEGRVIKRFGEGPKERVISKDVANLLKDFMVDVVRKGTGTMARIRGVEVAGKTGTAEVPGKSPHSWFIAFAPADNPRIALSVVVENGGIGGKVAAPIAKRILEASLPLLYKGVGRF
jgi:cell division protein FtsI/penicillin-binding protein 2/cell division protein FtsW (lipid II flippase)